MADESGLAVVTGIVLATGIIVLIAKPEIITGLFAKGGGVGVGPGTSPPTESVATPPATSPETPLPATYMLPTPEQEMETKQKKNDPRLNISISPGSSVYQGTYFKITTRGFAPHEHVNFYFTSRELLATGRYKFNTITTGGEIQHAVDKADSIGQAEVKMLAPDGVGGPADIVAMGIESGRQVNTTMFILATNRPRPIKRFRMNVGGEKFFVISTDPHITRGLVDLSQGKPSLAHIHGKVGYGPGKSGFNRPWNWHLIPTTVTLSELTTTTCDVRPSMIQRDPSEYIRRNGYFCPLAAKVEAIEYV